MDYEKLAASKIVTDLEATVKSLDQMRIGKDKLDMNFSEYMTMSNHGDMSTVLEELGIDASSDTLALLFTVPNPALRWIVPEIIREAIQLGLRKKAIWPSLVAGEETLKVPQATIPYINLSDVAPVKVGEGETIGLGAISYGQKKFELFKMGRGMKISYEVRQYVSLNIFSIFVQDFGIKLGLALDAMLINTIINGEQANGSASAPVLGVITPTTLAYQDILKIWVRMARMGRTATTMIAGESMGIETLMLTEFRTRQSSGPTYSNLNLKTPVPQSADFYIHGAVPDNQIIMIDPSTAIIKYNAQPLLLESEKVVSNQTEAIYATLTTGFAKTFRDASLVLDKSLNVSSNGFPSYMDVDPLENVDLPA